MQRILIVEDDLAMQSFLKTLCESAGFKVEIIAYIQEALAFLATNEVHLVLLDLGLPDGNGQDFIQKVAPTANFPIIVISARDTDFDKITALDCGADDYVAKPFSAGELLARIRVALRRQVSNPEPVLKKTQVQHLSVDFESQQVFLEGQHQAVHLTPIEYRLLELLIRNPNKVLTYSTIGKAVWGSQFTGSTEKIRVHIAQLRQKVELEASTPSLIINAPGVGYRLNY